MCLFPLISLSDTVQQIIVEGTVHADKNEILDVIQTKPGDELETPAGKWQVRNDIRAVFALGHFKDVRVVTEKSGDGSNLIFEIEEKPIIDQIKYEGNRKIKNKKLNTELKFDTKEKPIIFFDESLAESYKETLLALYTKQSFPNTEISWRSEELSDPNKVNLVFQINEGEKKPIKDIVFQGNTVLTEKDLKRRIQTKESWWFIIKRNYDEAIAATDLERIRYAYWDKGYLDVEVEEAKVEEMEGGLRVTFAIKENEPYTLGSINITGNTIFSTEELLSKMTLKPGDRFSAGQLANDELAMINLYRQQGYNLPPETGIPQIKDQLIRDSANHIVDVRLPIQETDRKHLGKVEIQGVVTLEDGIVVPTKPGEFKTREFVIRREIELEEGEALDWTKVVESDRQLVNTGFFKTQGIPQPNQLNLSPGFERVPTSDPEVENLLLRLEEQATGMFSPGVGYSSSFGPSAFVTLSESNLFGYGVRGSVTAEYGKYRNRFLINLYEPHLLNSDYSADWDVYFIDQQGYGGRRFDEERIGSSIIFGKEITDEWKVLFGTKGEQTDLSPERGNRFDLDPTTIPSVFNIGENVTTSLTLGFVYDSRNFRLDPSEGWYSRVTTELAGLTDNEFVKFRSDTSYYMPVFDRMVLALSAEVDLAHAYGDPGFVPLQERFFIGGANSIRGFDEGGIGEFADIRYLDPTFGGFRTYLGGEAAFVGNVELRYPLSEIFQLVTFLDMGSAWPEIGDIDPSDFRFSTGLGMRVRIPGLNALLRLDFPIVLRKLDEDDDELFHFSFGQSF